MKRRRWPGAKERPVTATKLLRGIAHVGLKLATYPKCDLHDGQMCCSGRGCVGWEEGKRERERENEVESGMPSCCRARRSSENIPLRESRPERERDGRVAPQYGRGDSWGGGSYVEADVGKRWRAGGSYSGCCPGLWRGWGRPEESVWQFQWWGERQKLLRLSTAKWPWVLRILVLGSYKPPGGAAGTAAMQCRFIGPFVRPRCRRGDWAGYLGSRYLRVTGLAPLLLDFSRRELGSSWNVTLVPGEDYNKGN